MATKRTYSPDVLSRQIDNLEKDIQDAEDFLVSGLGVYPTDETKKAGVPSNTLDEVIKTVKPYIDYLRKLQDLANQLYKLLMSGDIDEDAVSKLEDMYSGVQDNDEVFLDPIRELRPKPTFVAKANRSSKGRHKEAGSVTVHYSGGNARVRNSPILDTRSSSSISSMTSGAVSVATTAAQIAFGPIALPVASVLGGYYRGSKAAVKGIYGFGHAIGKIKKYGFDRFTKANILGVDEKSETEAQEQEYQRFSDAMGFGESARSRSSGGTSGDKPEHSTVTSYAPTKGPGLPKGTRYNKKGRLINSKTGRFVAGNRGNLDNSSDIKVFWYQDAPKAPYLRDLLKYIKNISENLGSTKSNVTNGGGSLADDLTKYSIWGYLLNKARKSPAATALAAAAAPVAYAGTAVAAGVGTNVALKEMYNQSADNKPFHSFPIGSPIPIDTGTNKGMKEFYKKLGSSIKNYVLPYVPSWQFQMLNTKRAALQNKQKALRTPETIPVNGINNWKQNNFYPEIPLPESENKPEFEANFPKSSEPQSNNMIMLPPRYESINTEDPLGLLISRMGTIDLAFMA